MLFPTDSFTYLSAFEIDKYKETRGYIYLLIDSCFPNHIKIGRAFNLQDRLNSYNDDRPFDTCRFIAISRQFEDVITIERDILKEAKYNVQTNRLEWFDISERERLIAIVSKYEKI